MLSKPARGKQPTPQPWPSPPEMAPYHRIWSPILGAYASDRLGTMPQASEFVFSPAMSRSKALKTLRWCSGDGDEFCLAIRAFWGLETGSLPEKSIFACSGHRPPSIKRVEAVLFAFKVALGGHFWRRQPWWCGCCWPLAVGRWSLGAFAGTNPT
jgi:hypothetical protein